MRISGRKHVTLGVGHEPNTRLPTWRRRALFQWRVEILVSILREISSSSSSTMAPRTLILRQLTTHFANRIRQNQRLLSSHLYSSSALEEAPSSSSSTNLDGVHMTDTCIQKMKQLKVSEAQEKMLRLRVETGGCSGFQYVFDLVDDKTNPDDRVFEKELVVDNISYDFLKGATVDYVEELIRSAFQVTENPSAVQGCSCKSSFMVKL
ncbi:hypothetical protein ACLB2K_065878 [Fragaria x ananassa]